MLEKLKTIEEKYNSLTEKLSSPEILANQKEYNKLAKELNYLEPIKNKTEDYKVVLNNLNNNLEIIKIEEDKEIVELAQEELSELREEKEKIENELKKLLIPKDPLDEKNIIMEIRAGTGGDESTIFVADLFRMYSRYAELKNWKIEIMSSNGNGVGGYKEIIFMISGKNVYSKLKYESGVHRVQRVPETESQGRVHTSAITVAVLPEADEVDIEIKNEDLRIDVFRASGCGGQCVNTTDSAVRITHIPTGIVVSCQDEKSQLKNKNKGMKVLRSRLLDIKMQKAANERAEQRKSQVGSGDRSERIRTYNYPQNRLTDHRINLTLYKLSVILEGDLDETFEALATASEIKKIQNL